VDLAGIMDALAGVALTGLPVTSKYAWPQESVLPPAWIIGYDNIAFDLTFGRGADTVTIPCYYVVGSVTTKAARDKLSVVIGGANAVKEAIEAVDALNGRGATPVADSTWVKTCTPDTVTIGAVPMLAARFDVEVVA